MPNSAQTPHPSPQPDLSSKRGAVPTPGTVVVTGGASGIGAATCRRLAATFAHVVVLDRDAAGAERIADGIGGVAVVADVADPEQVDGAFEMISGLCGGELRGLVNNAGVGNLKPLEQYTPEEVDLIWRVNVAGTYNCLRAAAPYLRATQDAAVVNIASVSGIRPTRGEAPYSAAKAAVVALTSSAALEWAPQVRVNCVSPGFIRTPLNEMLASDDSLREGIEQRTPLGRMGNSEETAELIAALLSAAHGYLTGQNIVLDGGSTLDSSQMDPVLAPLLGGATTQP
ncbi:MAG: SDR family NAD(P)-dependent oxidoreductase [Microthrixaceae bacterium]